MSDDAPEWTDEMFDHAEIRIGNKVIRQATGVLTKDESQSILSLSKDRFRATGKGWQSRINEALRKAVGI